MASTIQQTRQVWSIRFITEPVGDGSIAFLYSMDGPHTH